MKLLILGGTGFLSGRLATLAQRAGHDVWIVTRGNKPIPEGMHAIQADRRDGNQFKNSVEAAGTEWDAVFDCIGMLPSDAKQDIDVFRSLTKHLIFVSTDFVFDPNHMRFPQPEESDHYAESGYGGNKRRCELEFMSAETGDMVWTVLRSSHIYGPGSNLGNFPAHGRDPKLIERILAGEPLTLVGGGHFLQHPIFVDDQCEVMLGCLGNEKTYNQIFGSHGPEAVEARKYYEIIANLLGVSVTILDTPLEPYLKEHPEHAPFLCNRIYDLSKLRGTGVPMPATSLEAGLTLHVQSLLEASRS